MTSSQNRRNYSRISSEVAVRWAGAAVEKPLRDYLGEVASNVSVGGLFIDADTPPPVGTVIKLELRLAPGEGDSEGLRATAIVRWRRRWTQPRGMGVQFIDFEGLGEKDLKEWLETVVEEA